MLFTEAQFPQQEVPSRRVELNGPGEIEWTDRKNLLGHLAGSEACSILPIHQFGQFILSVHQFLLISTRTFQQHKTKDFSLNRGLVSFFALSNIYECLFSTCLTPISLTWLLCSRACGISGHQCIQTLVQGFLLSSLPGKVPRYQKPSFDVRVPETPLWGGWELEAWGSDPSNCCPQFPMMGDTGITVTTEDFSETFFPCLFSFCSAFWLPYIICGRSIYKSGEASQWTLQSHFLGWLTPGDIVKLEVFKWLHWILGNGYYTCYLDLKWPAMTMHWNMKTITSNLLANLLHPGKLWESL